MLGENYVRKQGLYNMFIRYDKLILILPLEMSILR